MLLNKTKRSKAIYSDHFFPLNSIKTADKVGILNLTFFAEWVGTAIIFWYVLSDADECALNTDTCDDVSSTCGNTIGSFDCICNSGFESNGSNTCIGMSGTLAVVGNCDLAIFLKLSSDFSYGALAAISSLRMRAQLEPKLTIWCNNPEAYNCCLRGFYMIHII